MSIPLTEVTTVGGPLPEGDLCQYSYDPVTSTVYLARLVDESFTPDRQVLYFTKLGTGSKIKFSGNLFPGIIKYNFTSYSSGIVGYISIKYNDELILNEPLKSSNTFDTQIYGINEFGLKTNDYGMYEIEISQYITSAHLMMAISLELPTSESGYTTYSNQFNQLPALSFINFDDSLTVDLINTELFQQVPISNFNQINTSWGYIRKNAKHIALQTIAPFPPTFYDSNWYDLVDYKETSAFTAQYVQYNAYEYLDSLAYETTPDLSKAVKLITDTHARTKPTCYDIAIITQETSDRQLLWRCFKEQRIYKPATVEYTVGINIWKSSENVYKYKSGKIFFGGKNYSGPLNTILFDNGDGITYSEHAILDLNEFPINSNNEVFVYDHVSNYSLTAPKVYCVLNKLSGRMAEIDVNTKTIKYFTLVVPIDHEIQKLFFTTRLMYTVKHSNNSDLSLYDANNNGVLLHTFDLGTYDPSVQPQFMIIN